MAKSAVDLTRFNRVQANTSGIAVNGPLARPFVKWVGGKGKLLSKLNMLLPAELKAGMIKSYLDPFVGGGAVFFHVMQTFAVKESVISDANSDLILLYRVIQKKPKQLCRVLGSIENSYLNLSESQRSKHYYAVRKEFNESRFESNPASLSPESIHRAALLIFLNKTCFNGLFRVNSSGGFNVAFGRYNNPNICDHDNILRVHSLLQKSEILLGDFQEILPHADESSFVYLDPPYRPITETANFTSYSASTFTNFDQQRLAKFCQRITAKGARVMMSNSDPHNSFEDDGFFEKMYPNFSISRIMANRAINCKAEGRGKISELVLVNY